MKVKFWHFWHLLITPIHKIQWFHLTTVNFQPKIFCIPSLKTPQPVLPWSLVISRSIPDRIGPASWAYLKKSQFSSQSNVHPSQKTCFSRMVPSFPNSLHTAWIGIWMTKRPGATSGNGFILKKINNDLSIKETKRSYGRFWIYQLISTANPALICSYRAGLAGLAVLTSW